MRRVTAPLHGKAAESPRRSTRRAAAAITGIGKVLLQQNHRRGLRLGIEITHQHQRLAIGIDCFDLR